MLGLFNLIKKMLLTIAESVNAKSTVSTVRVQSYMLLFTILVTSFIFVSIEVSNAIFSYLKGLNYTISTESVVILGMLLAHHVTLLFNRPKLGQTTTSYLPESYVNTVTTTNSEQKTTINAGIGKKKEKSQPNIVPPTETPEEQIGTI